MVGSNERQARLAFKLLPFVVLVAAGAIMLLFAFTAFWGGGERVFEPYLGISGTIAIVVGLIGTAMIALTR